MTPSVDTQTTQQLSHDNAVNLKASQQQSSSSTLSSQECIKLEQQYGAHK